MTETAVTGDTGIWGVGRLFTAKLGWHYRPQGPADVGIDVLVEPILGGHSSGRILALQIKAGKSWFTEPTATDNGWVFRESNQKHRDYWLNFKVPVLLVLYDVEKDVAYWQHVTRDTAIVTGKGFKIEVPASQRVDTTASNDLARLARQAPPDGLSELLDKLPSSCADRLRLWDVTDPVGARDLAAKLVTGQDHPAETVHQVTAGWAEDHPWLAWMAVGEYAHEYGLPAVAAESFLAAARAEVGAAPSERLRAFAGLMLTSIDPERARGLFEGCLSDPQTHLLSVVGLATLDHAEASGPIPVPAEVTADPDNAAREPTVQWFLAQQRHRQGDWDGAVRHHQQALAHAPSSAKQTLAVAEALLRRAGTGSIASATSYREASLHAEAARANFRRWRGNSVPAAHLLMQARIMAADAASAYRVARAQPDGEATSEEAASPLLAFTAARLAYGHGDLARAEEFAAVVEACGEAIWMRHLAATRADALGADRAEREQAWRAVLAVDDDVSRRVTVCAHLAAMGCWPIPELDDLHAAGALTPGTYETQHARALAAAGDPSQALVVLRQLRQNSLIAAEAHAQLLAQLGRVEDCVRACEDASTRLGAGHLEILALDVLRRAGLTDQVITRATEQLSRTDLSYTQRHHIRARLIDEHVRRQAWSTCEQLAHRGLREISHLQADLASGRHDALLVPASAAADLADLHRQYAWMIIIQQLNQGQTNRAFDTLQTLTPGIESTVEAEAWFDLHQLHGWTPATAEIALSLAQQPGQAPDLAGKILSMLVQSIRASDDTDRIDFHQRLRAAWRSYLQQHQPSHTPMVEASSEQVRDQTHAALEAHSDQFQSLSAAIRNAALPVGAVSTATGRPYLLCLVERVAGLLPAVASNEETNELERQSAAAALGEPIAVETSALYLAAGLLNHWSVIHNQFSDVLLADLSERDIRHSRAMAYGLSNVAGVIALNPGTDQMRFSEHTDTTRTTTISLCTAVHTAAQTCRVVPTVNLDALWTDTDPQRGGAWLAPIAHAIERQIPLYSDDIVLRATARSHGVPAFGTLTLLDALIAAGRETPAPDPVALTSLFDHQVVDLVQAADLLLTGLDQHGPLAPQIQLNLARPALWRRRPIDTIPLVLALMDKLPRHDARSLAAFISASAAGLASAFTPADEAVARLAALVLAFHTGVTPEAARIVVPATQGIAEQFDTDSDHLPRLRETLIGILTDPTGEFRMTSGEATDHAEAALHDFG